MDAPQRILALTALGALGALARYGLGEAALRVLPGPPWCSTLIVNVLGCFLFGIIDRMALLGVLTPGVRLVLLVGFVGSFTTFSTYAFEIVTLASERDFTGLSLQLLAQNLLGVLAVLAGMALAAGAKP